MSIVSPAISSPAALHRQQSEPVPLLAPLTASQTSWRWQSILQHTTVILLLFSLCWIAHFSRSSQMGFYSDDHTFAVHVLSWSWNDFSIWLRTQAIQYPEPQGRPLGFFLGEILPYAAFHAAGVQGLFVVGWFILSLNATLLYLLLQRCFSKPIPLLAALFFLLYPADTTRSFLCHLHILQPSLTFMLIAGHLYLRGNLPRKVLAYFVVTLCLITYETALLPFLAVPLLEQSFDKAWRRRFLKHIATLFLIITFIALTRQLGGEYRAVEATGSKGAVLLEMIAGSFIGPCVALAACFWRIITATNYLFHTPATLFTLIIGATLTGAMIRFNRDKPQIQGFNNQIKHAMLFGSAALIISYILCFTHFPPNCLTGQITSVHLAGAIGGSTLLAALAACLIHFCQTQKWKVIATSIIAIYMGILLVNAHWEQDGYVTVWNQRQQFWKQVLPLCPDLTDRTLIICDGQMPSLSKIMPANSWSDTQVLSQLFQFPADFTLIPELLTFPDSNSNAGWQTYLTRNPMGRAIWNKPVVGIRDGTELVEQNTILLHVSNEGIVSRQSLPALLSGKPFHPKSLNPTDPQPRYPTLPFYQILIHGQRSFIPPPPVPESPGQISPGTSSRSSQNAP